MAFRGEDAAVRPGVCSRCTPPGLLGERGGQPVLAEQANPLRTKRSAVTIGSSTGTRVKHPDWLRALGCRVALGLTLAAPDVPTAAVARPEAPTPVLQLRVLVADARVVRTAPEITITLRLTNTGDAPAYVSPAVGQMVSRLSIRARRVDSIEPATGLYLRAGSMRDQYWNLGDLFELLPGRSLELDLPLQLPERFLRSGRTTAVEFWADYDFSGMSRVAPEAAAAHLVSPKVVATFEVIP